MLNFLEFIRIKNLKKNIYSLENSKSLNYLEFEKIENLENLNS